MGKIQVSIICKEKGSLQVQKMFQAEINTATALHPLNPHCQMSLPMRSPSPQPHARLDQCVELVHG